MKMPAFPGATCLLTLRLPFSKPFYSFCMICIYQLRHYTTAYNLHGFVTIKPYFFQTLKSNNIEPLVTIYHWDLPLPFHELGGWTNPVIADYFAEFASLCYSLFGDYVKFWVTLNEPLSTCYFGYGSGAFAPGIAESGTATYRCAYTHLLAHAKAYRIYNDTFKATQNGE